uniref:Nucleoprotein n=1 Tax=Linum virus 1 TaxID=2977971 RepID=A0A9N7AAT3_9RHAB|nr:TPA_asm: nucleocapsid protein [Linum virus 1]
MSDFTATFATLDHSQREALLHTINLIASSMHQFQNSQNVSNQGVSGYVLNPDESIDPERPNPALVQKLEAARTKQYKIPDVIFNFDGANATLSDVTELITEFKDNHFQKKPAYKMRHLDVPDLAELGRQVLGGLGVGFDKYRAAALFTLAFNLKTPDSNYHDFMFQELDIKKLESISDKRFDDFDAPPNISRNDPYSVRGGNGDLAREGAEYAYIAASILRIWTKSAKNYILAWDHIRSGFKNFYGEEMVMVFIKPTEDTIQKLYEKWSIDEKARMTLYRFLYASESNKEYSGLKRFLFGLHLQMTGLHAVNILLGLVKALHCSPGEVLKSLLVDEFTTPIENLFTIIELYMSKDNQHKRGMWRYARLFEQKFMCTLQTRSCPRFVYILASMLHYENPTTHKGILQIVQLKDLNPDVKYRCKITGEVIVNAIRRRNVKLGYEILGETLYS